MERIRQRRHACSAVPGPAASPTISAAAASLWAGASDGRCCRGRERGSTPKRICTGCRRARAVCVPASRRAACAHVPARLLTAALGGGQVLTPGQAFKLLADAVAGGPAVLGRGVALLGVVRVEAAPVCGNGVRRRPARAWQLRNSCLSQRAGPRVAITSSSPITHAGRLCSRESCAQGTHARCRIPSSLAACTRAFAACRRTTQEFLHRG